MKDSLACTLSDETKQCPLQRGSVSKETGAAAVGEYNRVMFKVLSTGLIT